MAPNRATYPSSNPGQAGPSRRQGPSIIGRDSNLVQPEVECGLILVKRSAGQTGCQRRRRFMKPSHAPPLHSPGPGTKIQSPDCRALPCTDTHTHMHVTTAFVWTPRRCHIILTATPTGPAPPGPDPMLLVSDTSAACLRTVTVCVHVLLATRFNSFFRLPSNRGSSFNKTFWSQNQQACHLHRIVPIRNHTIQSL